MLHFSLKLTQRFWTCLLVLLLLPCSGVLMGQKAKNPSNVNPASPAKLQSIKNSLGMTFVKIPPGSFLMGSRDSSSISETRCNFCSGRGDVRCDSLTGRPHYSDKFECNKCNGTGRMKCPTCRGTGFLKSTQSDEFPNERPAHRVTISAHFFLQTTTVTQGQWKTVMGTKPWEGKQGVREGDDYPAFYVSWEDAQEFIQQLNIRGKDKYRLPTEAEWEYACRSGSVTKFFFGDDDNHLVDFAWFIKNCGEAGEDYPHRVGSKRPNPWGLYDMHGNVGQWCQDWMGPYPGSAQTDPTGPSSSGGRVVRGGYWNGSSRYSRSAWREDAVDPLSRTYPIGFRLVKSGR